MIRRHVVTVVTVTVVGDGLGNTTEASAETTIEGVLYAPEGATESVDVRSPEVIGQGSLYGDFPRLSGNDRIKHDATCCDGAEFEHGVWEVVGGSRGWAPSRTVVPVTKAGAA